MKNENQRPDRPKLYLPLALSARPWEAPPPGPARTAPLTERREAAA
jgi:hypothetical protein